MEQIMVVPIPLRMYPVTVGSIIFPNFNNSQNCGIQWKDKATYLQGFFLQSLWAKILMLALPPANVNFCNYNLW
jgi:hypothetical protein